MADLCYRSVRVAMRTVLSTFSTWRVEGLENVPPYGPLLVVANHMSNIDPPLLAAGLPRRLHFHAKRSIFTPLTSWFLRTWGAFPVDRDGRDLDGYRWARRLLDQDKVLAMFPETTRSLTGMQRAIPGVAMLALHTQAPILPVGIEGTAHLGPYWRVATPTGRITLRIGQPFSLPCPPSRASSDAPSSRAWPTWSCTASPRWCRRTCRASTTPEGAGVKSQGSGPGFGVAGARSRLPALADGRWRTRRPSCCLSG